MGRIGRKPSRVVPPIIINRHGAIHRPSASQRSLDWKPPAILLENLAALNESAIIVEHSRRRIRELIGNSSLCRHTQQAIMDTVSQKPYEPDPADDGRAEPEPIAAKRSRRNCGNVRELFSISRMMRSDICSSCPLAEQDSCCYIEASQTLFEDEDADAESDDRSTSSPDRSVPAPVTENAQFPQLSSTKTQCFAIHPRPEAVAVETESQPADESPDDLRPLRRSIACQRRGGGGGGRLTPNAVMYTAVAEDGDGMDAVATGNATGELLPDERLFVSRSVRPSGVPGSSSRSADLSGEEPAAELDSGGQIGAPLPDGDWWQLEVEQQNSRITGLLVDLNELSSINLELAADLTGKLTQ